MEMDMATMKDLFKNIIFGQDEFKNGNGVLYDGEDSFSGSDYSDDAYNAVKSKSQENSDLMAKELISEEEKEKRKAEKRRAKKKKRREKKKQERELEHINKSGATDSKNDTPNGIRSSDEGEGIDPNAAFVKQSKKKKSETISAKPDSISSVPTPFTSKKNDSSEPRELSSVTTKKSRLIANSGNEAAHRGDYPLAILQFSEAIKLEPCDYRFFGNRSYCYDRIMQFDKALADADKCIELSPDWPKGYFRKGRALAGMKLFADAEKSFMQVLKLDKTCEEATKELSRVRTQQLIDMGFSPQESEKAVLTKNTLQQALDMLLAGVGSEMTLSGEDVYVSDDEVEDHGVTSTFAPVASTGVSQSLQYSVKSSKTLSNNQHTEAFSEEKKMDPTNPEGLTALWVGNVLPTVKEADLQNLFNRYGHVSSVRCLPEKYCAFVNFKSKEAAGKAMNALQNHEVQGQHLLIKFPDNPIATNGISGVAKLMKQATSQPGHKHDRRVAPSAESLASKVSGPVNGDECYFWRTTGCQFGAKCRWKHIPESRGIDKKPWQRVK